MKDKNFQIYKKLHLLSLLIGALTIILPILFWSKIPDQIPMHYNAAGVVDNWSDKSSLVLLFFMIAMIMGMMSIAVYFVKASMNSKYSSGTEKSQMHVVYPMLVLMNLILQLMLSYLMFCCVTCRPLGVLFLPVFLIGIFVPVAYMVYKSGKMQGPGKEQKILYRKIEKEEQGIIYQSAVDWWLALILGGTELMMLWFTIDPLVTEGKVDWFMIATTVLVTLILLPLIAIKYVMYPEHLLISMGLYGKVRVRYEDINGIKKTMNPLSSAAMSLKRIQIDYVENGMHQMVLISPKNRDRFIEELNKRR